MSNIREEILIRTAGGKDVFEHYFNIKEHGLFQNTYRNDTAPSCKLYYNHGRYVMRDFGSSEWSGDCFHIAAKILKLDIKRQFPDVIREIDKALTLCLFDAMGDYVGTSMAVPKPVVHEEKKREPLKFILITRNFWTSEIEYWNRYGITPTILFKYGVKSIQKCTIGSGGRRFQIFGTASNPSYAYMLNGGKGIKVYRPLSSVRFSYAGVLPSPYIFGWDQLPESGEDIFITGGEKDVLSLASHGFDAISFNSETANLPLSVIQSLSQRFKRIILLYDSDETGRRESLRQLSRLKEAGIGNIYKFTLPLSGTKKEKDISDFFFLGRTSSELRSEIAKLNKPE